LEILALTLFRNKIRKNEIVHQADG
jgi:hypothetical protein